MLISALLSALHNITGGSGAARGRTDKFYDSLVCKNPRSRVGHYTINWRSLERNKYAPWGRGPFGGLQLSIDEQQRCFDSLEGKMFINR